MKLGVIGAGKMGMSIINAIVKKGLYKKEEIILYDAFETTRKLLAEQGFFIATNELDCYENSEMLLLSVKPQNFVEVLSKLKNQKGANTIISIAAGISIDYIASFLGEKEYARLMPNTPALIGKAASVIAYRNVSDKTNISKIFTSIGILEEVQEDQIDEIIPLNGSMPAYAYYFVKAFVDSAVKRGIDYELAKRLASQSVIGSCEMILNSPKTIDELIKDVCSPKGTTLEGLYVLENNHMDKVIDECSIACSNRSKELGKK